LQAASLHLNAYLMNAVFLEFNVSASDLLKRMCPNPPQMTIGYVSIPTGPGLGVEVDEKVINEFRVL
jgi:L-rhamnonate dehydratase